MPELTGPQNPKKQKEDIMKTKLTLLVIAAAFLCPMFTGFELAVADNDMQPECVVTVSQGQSIQAAIVAANAGDVICVEPGTYEEDLSIFIGLALVGLKQINDFDDAENRPVIQGVATVPAAQFPLAIPNIDIQADHVSIHGFVIKSPAVAEDEYSSGIVLTGRGHRIFDNLFYVGTGDISQAIQTWRQDNAREGFRDISGLHIYNNRFKNLEPATGLGAYEGIFINPQSDPIDPSDPASAVVIEKNRFSGALIRAVTGTFLTVKRES